MGSSSSKTPAQQPQQTQNQKQPERKVVFPDGSNVDYGHKGVPVTLFSGKISGEIMKQLHQLDMFSCPQNELEGKGFYRCIDYPQLPKHIYYEGYFHSCRTSDSIPSLNPRKGSEMDKPAAPPLLRAIYIAFRKKNEEWLSGIEKEIKGLLSGEGNDGDKGKEVFVKGFDLKDDQNIVLGDLAIQVHYGHPVGSDNIGFHTDGLNSAFHMALALRGDRKLHSHRSSTPELAKSMKFEHHVDPQEVGDVYISSPAFFTHGVEYPETTWEDRIIAVQARFLFSEEEADNSCELKFGQGEVLVGEIITKALLVGPVLPSDEEIIAVYETLEDFPKDV